MQAGVEANCYDNALEGGATCNVVPWLATAPLRVNANARCSGQASLA